MADAKTSFWTPARIGAVIGAVLLVVLLAYLVSSFSAMPVRFRAITYICF